MSIYDTLNDRQKEAVFCTEGPLLLLAGAGAGKTRVLTHRICYLIEEKGVNPWNIMAITFTNKAAKEMRERVDSLVGYGSSDVWVSTFHSTCVRILRRHADKIGYKNNFTIYDGDDQKRLMKDVCKSLNIDTKQFPEKNILGEISRAKDMHQSESEYEKESYGDFRKSKIAQVYKEYQKRLKANNAMDFDDLLCKTVDLFQFYPDILEKYQDRFRYIMVDEYQDTNTVQFYLIRMLARKYRNLCVVGDDDQSIYKFRGANIYNILNFEKEFEDATVMKLEQNYRSTKNILELANNVISNNRGRKQKTLWTENEKGEKVFFSKVATEYDEAEMVAKKIEEACEEGSSYKDFAILYRTNAQSRVLEEKLIFKNIPYKIIGGINFYQRKEIKDMIAYLKVVDSGLDDLATKRIINVPKRGIGDTTIQKIEDFALQEEMGFLEAAEIAQHIGSLGKATVTKIKKFTDFIDELREVLRNEGILSLYDTILEETGYKQELIIENTDESHTRLENLEEFRNKIVEFEEEKNSTLTELLEEIALIADIDGLQEESDRVVLMTLHSAKGLEFPYVFLVGLEDGIFPGYRAIASESEEDMEEERRLCYVGITRAKKQLYLSYAQRRMMRGQMQYNTPSRFLEEMPGRLLQETKKGRDSAVSSMNKGRNFANTAWKTASFDHKPYQTMQNFENSKAASLDYSVGDRVNHIKFGAGTVKQIVSGGRDYEVTVNFDRVGLKKMFASFAKLKKL
ncbi:MAG: DNA helicase PcrA [Lachnospiraceae bacterium]